MNKIIVNKIKCKKCGDVIESTYKHDFKFCKCGAVAVNGGKDYLRRVGYEEDYEELSEIEKENDKDNKKIVISKTCRIMVVLEKYFQNLTLC